MLKKILIILFLSISILGCSKKSFENTTGAILSQEDTLQIINEVDIYSNTRPISIMINNHDVTRPYHSGIGDAYVVYELIVEGGFTRYLAFFKNANTERIGSVRSSRHDFLDYAFEHDAIYTHFGWSPQAQADINRLNVDNVNFLYDSGSWRENLNIASEHTAFTSIENIQSVMNYRNYATTTETPLPFTYNNLDFSLNEASDALIANALEVNYSYSVHNYYTYNTTTKRYDRFVNDVAHTDYISKEQYSFKNIIVIGVANRSLDGTGRQDLDNVGTGSGYYITNGYARPINYQKDSRSAATVYTYLDGSPVILNDGNTFIHLQPLTYNTEFYE